MNIDNNFFIGTTNTNIFRELMKYMTEDLKQFLGKVYDVPDKEGKICSVEIVLGNNEGVNGMKFIYGLDSMGPPKPVVNYVEAAITITNPWFYKQQKMIKNQKQPRKWWEFWK